MHHRASRNGAEDEEEAHSDGAACNVGAPATGRPGDLNALLWRDGRQVAGFPGGDEAGDHRRAAMARFIPSATQLTARATAANTRSMLTCAVLSAHPELSRTPGPP